MRNHCWFCWLVAFGICGGCTEAPRNAVAPPTRVVQSVGDPAAQQPLPDLKDARPVPASPSAQEATDEEEQKSSTTDPRPQQEQKPQQQPETSRLDQALQNLEGKPLENPHAPPVVEPAEVHEALKPLVEESWTRLHPGYEVWFDMKTKQVIVGGRVCFRKGPLEMFACPMHTKEHESVVATVSNAQIIHAGLLAVGAINGKPVQWEPEYQPASGTVVKITVKWTEDDETREVPAKQMIVDSLTEQPSTYDWVFGGSQIWTDPDDPEYREYFADAGDMICVSNFTTAMLDLPVESSATNAGLRFFANTEKIPALGTPVLLVLKPDLSTNPKADDETKESAEKQPEGDAAVDK